jgi:S1-C subfamily serine protease
MDLGGLDPERDPDDLYRRSDDEDDESPLRGWIPPDDRLWRHPSEMGARAPAARSGAAPTGPARRPSSQERRALLSAGVAASAAVVALIATVTLTNSTHAPVAGRVVPATDTSLVSPVDSATASRSPSTTVALQAGMQQLVDRLSPSLVQLVSVVGRQAVGTAVVIGNGTLLLTSASIVTAGAGLVAVTTSGHRMSTRVVGWDDRSGIAVLALRQPGVQLVPASFADEAVQPGQTTIATCLCIGPITGKVLTPQVAVSTVRVTGNSVDIDQGAPLVDAIEADAPLSPHPAGGVLLDAEGRVIGILDGVISDGDGDVGVFVPAPLAVGVAQELAGAGQISHGWLGLSATDVLGGCGAQVVAVMPDMPAAMAGVDVGDVVDGVNGHEVCSLAELQARLYVAPPGHEVQLQLETSAGPRTLSMALTPAA